LKNADHSRDVRHCTSFGTRGSQVKILPLRPTYLQTSQSFLSVGRKPLRVRRDSYRDRNRHCPILKMKAPAPWQRQPGRKSKRVFWEEQLQNTASRTPQSSPLPSLFVTAKIASTASPTMTESTAPATLPHPPQRSLRFKLSGGNVCGAVTARPTRSRYAPQRRARVGRSVLDISPPTRSSQSRATPCCIRWNGGRRQRSSTARSIPP
jgi:hypothetical protein